MTFRTFTATLAAVVLTCACSAPVYEGDDPGECSDAADNDLDGLFDCNDQDCFNAPACTNVGYPNEHNQFDGLPTGEAQMTILCDRMAKNNINNVIRDAFCVEPRPVITNSQELLDVIGLGFHGPGGPNAQMGYDNGNPAWALTGHSAGPSRRFINPVFPRAVVYTPALNHTDPTPGFVIFGFVRGEGFAELLAHDPIRDVIDFYVFKFELPCMSDTYDFWDPDLQQYFHRNHCTDEEMFSGDSEFGWLDYGIYSQVEAENTALDCLHCHVAVLRSKEHLFTRRSLNMWQLNSMWMHWLYDNHHFFNWTENPLGMGPFHTMLQQYVSAWATEEEPYGETFGGIPRGAVYASRPKGLEDLITANGYGNGFDDAAYEANGASTGLLEDGRARGMLTGYAWEELYALNLSGLMLTQPGRGEIPFDTEKLQALIEDMSAYRNGLGEFPEDVLDVFRDDSLAAVGLEAHPGLTAPEIIVQACSQCHHEGMITEGEGHTTTLSRTNFTVGPIARWQPESGLGDHFRNQSAEALERVKYRINLPDDHLFAMPPHRIRSLNSEDRATVTEWLDTIIAGLAMADDGNPPLPLNAEFDVPPSRAGYDIGQGDLTGPGWEAIMPNVQRSMVTMVAVPGFDPAGYVEYFFEETTGNVGGTSSGWQLSPRYLDTNLVPATSYSYRVKMRDRAGNEGMFSAEATFEVGGWSACPPVPVDSDCDTVPDADEADGDTDGDGTLDINDVDDDGDYIATQTEVEDGAIYGHDVDGDGIPNRLDTNSDSDPFTDLEEGGGFPIDGSPLPVYLDPNYPCGDGICRSDSNAGLLSETCSTCPADCGECQ